MAIDVPYPYSGVWGGGLCVSVQRGKGFSKMVEVPKDSLDDMMLYGTAFYKVVDGQRVHIPVETVYHELIEKDSTDD